MRPATTRRERTPAEKARAAVAHEIADAAFKAVAAIRDSRTRRLACERLARLTGAQVAVDHGEAALHCALSGAVVAGAPAFRSDKPGRPEAEAAFTARTPRP